MTFPRIVGAEEVGGERIAAFIDAQWPRRIALTDRRFYDWQMRHAVLAQGVDHSLVVLDDDGEVRGYYGVTPRRLIDTIGREHRAAELTTLFLSKRVRGSILIWQIIARLQGEYAALFGMNISPMALPVFRRAGFHHLHCIERMVRIYDPAPFAEAVELTRDAQNLLSLQSDRAGVSPPAIVADLALLSERFGSYRIPATYHLARDFADLRWRYLDHPYHRHELFLLEPDDKARQTLVVLRRESHRGFGIAHILDVLPLGAELADVPAFADAFARRYGLALVDIHATQPRITAPFWAARWLSTANDHEAWMPGLFNPIEMRHPPSGNMTFWSGIEHLDLLDLAALYITKADVDLDRPTRHALDRISQ